MSKKVEIYEKLKELFNLAKESETTVEVKFEDVKLKDGSMLRGDLKLGSKMQIVAADGTISDAADSEYELEDGRKLTIKSGVIDNITEVAPATEAPATPTDEPMAAAAPEAPVAEVAPEAPAEAEMDGMLPTIVADLASRVAALEAALGDANKLNADMSAVIEKMSKEPGAPAIIRTSVAENFSTDKKEDYFTKIESLSSYRK